jgi:FAD/FMN-containing dehydrogenase
MDALTTLNLATDQIKTDISTLQYYGKDWTTYFDIKPKAIVFPQSTEDVVKIVRWARKYQIGLVPSGGRTGLSGAACALNEEVVVSFERMQKIVEFNSVEATVTIEAGVITEELQKFAKTQGLYYPVDFAARGSSQMGGNIATNAGGIKVLRYGLTRDWIVGLEFVTGAGEILRLNNGLVKNATGLDLRHLVIGSEGILGFITKAQIRLASPPPAVKVLVLALDQMSSVMKVFAEFRRRSTVQAYEMFSEKALSRVIASTGLQRPFETVADFYVVCEVECPTAEHENDIMNLFESCLEKGWITDGVISQSEQQERTFWRYREDISEALAKHSPYKNDISVTTSRVPDFMTDLEQLLKTSYPDWDVVWFGHIGDGNLHINILRPTNLTKEQFVSECRKVDGLIFSLIQKYQGSISAEHGVGLTKKSFLQFTRSAEEVRLMQLIKKAFDPDGIMNPGKVIEPAPIVP